MQDVGQKCLAQGRTGSVAVGDEFLSVEGLLDDLSQRSYFVQAGVVGFERLFHGSRDDLVLPFGLERASLAMLRGEGDDLRDPDFRGFFEEPFEPVVVFRRGDGHRQAVGQLAEFAVGVAHPHPAAFGIVVHDFTAVEVTAAVGDVQLFAAGHAKHADAVFRLFLAERIFRRNDIGGVKQLHFL